MIHQTFTYVTGGMLGSSIGMAILATTTELLSKSDPKLQMVWEGVERWGSFAIFVIAALFIMWGLARIIPAIGAWIVDRDDKFTAQLDRSRVARIESERLEREARERSLRDFREMLKEHTDTVSIAIANQTNHLDLHLQANNKSLNELRHLAEKAAYVLEEEDKKSHEHN